MQFMCPVLNLFDDIQAFAKGFIRHLLLKRFFTIVLLRDDVISLMPNHEPGGPEFCISVFRRQGWPDYVPGHLVAQVPRDCHFPYSFTWAPEGIIQSGAEPTDTFQMVIDNIWKQGNISKTVYKYVQVQWTLELRPAWHTNNLGYDQTF
jgi:hypothetical protein